MNKKELFNLIGPLIKETVELDEQLLFNDLSIHLESAKKGEIIFYYLEDGKEEKLKKRYRQGDYLLVLNKMPSFYVKNVLVIEDFLRAQKILSDIFYPLKRDKFKIVGVTGTNGKTTVAHLCMEISSMLGHSALSIGTLGVNSCKGPIEDFGMTTPYYILLRKILNKYQDDFDAFFIEVSSHGLSQERIFDILLDGAIWTSFSQDHLDYHHDMDEYFKAKKKIFAHIKTPLILPKDQKDLKVKLSEFNLKSAKRAEDRGFSDLPLAFKGGFNQQNLEVALEINEDLWGPLPILDLTKLKGPRGRFSLIETKKGLVVIDYAHTPDALENILRDLRAKFPQYTLNLLFGCGGNRDPSKREVMGKVATKFVDKGKIYLTSDNPRSEKPIDIISQVKEGIGSLNLEVIVHRKEAINKALNDLKDGEILLLAGKGHEEYQEIEGVKYPFSDFKLVEEFFNGSK